MEATIEKISEKEDVRLLMKTVNTASSWAEKLVVKTPEQEETAIKAVSRLKAELKRGDALRKFFTEPLNEQVKKINALFMPQLKALEAAEAAIKGKMSAYQMALAEKAEAKKDKIEEKIQKNEITLEQGVKKLDGVKEPEKTVRTEAATTTYVTTYSVEIENETLIPRDYLMPDLAKIKTVALAFHKAQQPQIPGIKIVEKKEPRIRSNF